MSRFPYSSAPLRTVEEVSFSLFEYLYELSTEQNTNFPFSLSYSTVQF